MTRKSPAPSTHGLTASPSYADLKKASPILGATEPGLAYPRSCAGALIGNFGLPDEEDEFNFAERFAALKAEFEAQLVEEARLNAAIAENLAKVRL